MQITTLQLKRENDYSQDKGKLIGTIGLQGTSGSQTMTLSDAAVLALLTCIQKEVLQTARKNAARTEEAFKEAIDGGLLLAADGSTALGQF